MSEHRDDPQHLEARIRELEGLAEAATPGPWQDAGTLPDGGTIFIQSQHNRHPNNMGDWSDVAMVSLATWDAERNAAFIAAASPDVVLDLIRSLRELQAQVEGCRGALEPLLGALDELYADDPILCDCVDNSGRPYTSAWLSQLMATINLAHVKARQALALLKEPGNGK